MVTTSGVFRTIDRCLGVRDDVVYLHHCFDYNVSEFSWVLEGKVLRHVESGRCLDAGVEPLIKALRVEVCDGGPGQEWTFSFYK